MTTPAARIYSARPDGHFNLAKTRRFKTSLNSLRRNEQGQRRMEGAGPESLNMIHRFGIIIHIAIHSPIARDRNRLQAGFSAAAQQAAENGVRRSTERFHTLRLFSPINQNIMDSE
ncbi:MULTISPECIES: hypothetical protein [Erwinia]|uniref:hypothetical protein n=1 Tax=Erwinia TaxID=551 RepID=UPI001415216E|nr:hypothetical protein [Erwinia aphidicola]MCP2234061.1 hypothetical protein [Erwinia aphidicola]